MRHGRAIRLTSVNWYGFDEKEFVAGGLDHAPLAAIVEQIKTIGVNSVRLPWANETLERNPEVPAYAVAANPELRGKHAMEVMDAVIAALAGAHLMVILDNHVSRADWCCSETDGNGLWYNAEYPEAKWLEDWARMARRYRDEPWVVGADLRNELRSGAAWGGTDAKVDWHAAAERGGAAVLGANSKSAGFGGEPALFDGFYGGRQAAGAVAGGRQAGVLAACVFRWGASLRELRGDEGGVSGAGGISAGHGCAVVGGRVRELPDARVRRECGVVSLDGEAAEGRQPVVVELLAAEWDAVEWCGTEI